MTKFLESPLEEVEPWETVTFAVVLVLEGLIARCATKADPMMALLRN